MSTREKVPGGPGDFATQDVVALLASIAFPLIEPFGSDTEVLAGLPARTPYPVPNPEPASRLSVARSVIDSSQQGLRLMKWIEDNSAACKASLVDRMMGAVAVESAATELDSCQSRVAEKGHIADIAASLGIAESSASRLVVQAQYLQEYPATREALMAGKLSWRHVCTILDEFGTLNETAGVSEQIRAEFEAQLLLLAVNTTPGRFASKARRARELLFPESCEVRTKQAFRGRSLSVDPGKDGMSWVTLHVPTIAANAIMVHCTRAARAIKAAAAEAHRAAAAAGTGEDCREPRTMDQLRADIAAILLMGQELPSTANYAPSPTTNGQGGKNGANGFGQRSSNSTSYGKGNNGGSWRTGSGSAFFPDKPPATSGTCSAEGIFGDSSHGDETMVPFGESSAFGVTLLDETAPWDRQRNAQPDPPISADASPVPDPKSADVPANGPEAAQDGGIVGVLVGDGSGFVEGVVDGVIEDPQELYVQELAGLAQHPLVTNPPMPKALVLLKVPLLGLLGITDEPAELVDRDAGPVPENIARRLLAGSPTFLRVFTDPVTGETLPLSPDRYTLRDTERSVLQALAGGCYFPNCTEPVMETDMDHVQSFEYGGKTDFTNLRPACKRHHGFKHFKDDKDRHGRYRRWDEPLRTTIRLRGWTPRLKADGRVGWTSPSGKYHKPEYTQPQWPAYPKWLKKCIAKSLAPGKTPGLTSDKTPGLRGKGVTSENPDSPDLSSTLGSPDVPCSPDAPNST